MGGSFELQGGKVESGEQSEEALTRDIRGETGVAISVTVRCLSITYRYPEKDVLIDDLLWEYTSGM